MASTYVILTLFIFLSSLPLFFFFMVHYENFLQKTILEFITILTPPDFDSFNIVSFVRDQSKNNILIAKYHPEAQIYWVHSITPEFSTSFISLCLLYLFPLHILSLLSTISTVQLASKMQSDQEPSFTFIQVMRASWPHKDRLKGIFVTSIYVLSLSSCALVGFIWLSIQSYTMGMTYYIDPMFTFVYPIGILVLLVKFLELSAVWSMSLVISVMEEVYGLSAFSLAFCFNKGSERRGLLMMFVFFVLELGLRIPSLFEGDVGIVARPGLLWVVHLVKWGACTWYFVSCKNNVLQKKADLEVGRKFEGQSSKNAT